MTDKQWIYVAGGVGALLLVTSKKGAANPLKKLTSKLLPKQVPRPTTTNLATGYGTRTAPGGPSSGIGFNPRTAAGPVGSQYSPKQVGIGAAIATAPNAIAALLNFLGRPQPKATSSGAGTTAPKSQPSSAGGGSPAGGGTGGPVGGGGATGRPGAPSNGGMMANAPTPDGFYDDSGSWVPTDPAGNILPNPDGNYPGYYDGAGNYNAIDPNSALVPGGTGSFDENGNWTPDIVDDGSVAGGSGSFDDAGNFVYDGGSQDPALEVADDPAFYQDPSLVDTTGGDTLGDQWYDDSSGSMVTADTNNYGGGGVSTDEGSWYDE